MATTLGDASVKLKLDTAEAEEKLRRLEAKIKDVRGGVPEVERTLKREIKSEVRNDSRPTERDDLKRAAGLTPVVSSPNSVLDETIKAVLRGAVTTEVILKAIQESPLLTRILENTVIPEAVQKMPEYLLIKNTQDELVARVDRLQAKLLNVIPNYTETYDLAKATARLGGAVNVEQYINMLNFIQERTAAQSAVRSRAEREIKKGVIDTLIQGNLQSMNR